MSLGSNRNRAPPLTSCSRERACESRFGWFRVPLCSSAQGMSRGTGYDSRTAIERNGIDEPQAQIDMMIAEVSAVAHQGGCG